MMVGRELQTVVHAWSPLGSILIGEAAQDNLGWEVSLSGDGSVLAAGAPSLSQVTAGSVRVYKYINNGWTQIGGDIDGEALRDIFGFSVSLSYDGTVLAIAGESNDGAAGTDSGHTRVYKYNDTSNSWVQLGADIEGEAAGDKTTSVSLSSDGLVLAVGARNNNGLNNISNVGHVRVYRYTTNDGWTQLGSDIDGDDIIDSRFGH